MHGQQETYGDASYGAAVPFKRMSPPSPQRNYTVLGLCMSLFFPWIIFSVNFGALSFELHYRSATTTSWICVATGAFVLLFGYVAFSHLRQRWNGNASVEVNWFMFLFVVSLIAWIVGIIVGDMNFWANLQPYYDITNLNTYPSVDPSKMKGQQMMDAGRIVFAEGSKVDLTRSTGFKNLDTYCVAPITIGEAPLPVYDFWAVGLNCCSGSSTDFHCGEFNNPNAHSGLRLMDNAQRSFYRLAVQQAEATHKIKANHPLFLYWMQDPHSEMQAYEDDGMKYFLLGVFGYFAAQLFMSLLAAIVFSKMG